MSPDEVYRRPTVKKVIFQVRFPNLFFMENIVPEFQRGIMLRFPESSLAIRKQFLFADAGSMLKKQDIPEELDEELQAVKIWQFQSEDGIKLNVQNGSLDMSTESHKTYGAPGQEGCFREVLDFVLGIFFELTSIQKISRVGLRYIDESPMPPDRNNDSFLAYYNTTLPLARFPLEQAKAMQTRSEVAKGDYFLTFLEALGKNKATREDVLVLDFDGHATNIPSDKCIEVADELHQLIHDEWDSFIKEPVRKWMREEPEVSAT